jgi:hypothetical protein
VQEEIKIIIPDNCKAIPACLDYQAYAFSVPSDLEPAAYQEINQALRQLGRLRHEMVGVGYVDADWGFLIIPPAGFPELKINFYRQTDEQKVELILLSIYKLMEKSITTRT